MPERLRYLLRNLLSANAISNQKEEGLQGYSTVYCELVKVQGPVLTDYCHYRDILL